MKYMRWSYDQLCACPAHYIDAIVEYSEREKEDAEEAEKKANR